MCAMTPGDASSRDAAVERLIDDAGGENLDQLIVMDMRGDGISRALIAAARALDPAPLTPNPARALRRRLGSAARALFLTGFVVPVGYPRDRRPHRHGDSAVREGGALTVAIGDFGNELGMGAIGETVRSVTPAGARCECACGGTAWMIAAGVAMGPGPFVLAVLPSRAGALAGVVVSALGFGS